MDCEIVKGKPLTKEESKFLLDLIENSKIITSKMTNATNNKLKNEEWIRLADSFNANTTNGPRTPQQLRLKWENLKKNSRKRSTKIRMNQLKTGGGPADYIPPDDILDRVTGLLGSTASGFSVPFGGDRETVGLDIGGGDGDGGSGDGFCDTRVFIESHEDAVLIPAHQGIETVICDNGSGVVMTDQVISNIDPNIITPVKPKRFTFSTPRAVRKKLKTDDGKVNRNNAIAEYFSAKKQCVEAKLLKINLENKHLKLRNLELKLKNENLVLESEKLKLELEKLRKQ